MGSSTKAMLSFLQQPYVFALTFAVLTAFVSFVISRVTDKDPTRSNRTLFKTLAAGILVGMCLTYLASSHSADTGVAEPFDAVPAAPGI